jgi:hypothetical protein
MESESGELGWRHIAKGMSKNNDGEARVRKEGKQLGQWMLVAR